MADETILVLRIKELKKAKKISARRLSESSGMSEGAISNILASKRPRMRADTVLKLARGLGTSVDYLQGVTDDPEASGAPPLPEYALEVTEYMRQLGGLLLAN